MSQIDVDKSYIYELNNIIYDFFIIKRMLVSKV